MDKGDERRQKRLRNPLGRWCKHATSSCSYGVERCPSDRVLRGPRLRRAALPGSDARAGEQQQAVSATFEAVRQPFEGRDLRAEPDFSAASDRGELELRATCISVVSRNRRVCLRLPLGIGQICFLTVLLWVISELS